MGNHFHPLVEVSHRETWLQRFDGPQGEAKLLEHLRILYSQTYVGLLRDELADLRQRGLEALAQQKLEAIKKRFCDLSLFVKDVKDAQNEAVVERGMSVESVRAVLAERGTLSSAELVRLRVRYFSDGAVLGSKAFVEGIFEAQRDQFSPKRKRGAKPTDG